MTVGELKSFLADKDENALVNITPSYNISVTPTAVAEPEPAIEQGE